jgi:hypothetical protein
MTAAMIYRRLRILLGVVCALVTGVAAADGPAPAVWAIGLPYGYIVMEHQAQAIDVTDEDVARGFVEVRGGSRIVVTTHAGARYALDFAARGSAFSSVQFAALGHAMALGAERATLIEHDAPAGRTTIAIDYRFRLAPGTTPGTYPWPLDIVARRVLPEEFTASATRSVLAAH